MGEIRAFSEEHVRDAANLNMRAIRGRKEPAGSELQNCFRDVFLRNPWVSPEITSLVYLENNKLVGFLGVVPRCMESGGKRIRVAVTSQFMIDREQHRGGAALELIRHLFRGPQDMSYTDGAGEGASIVWTAAGGRTARLYSFNWIRVLRPLQTARTSLAKSALSGLAGIITGPGDFLLSKVPLAALRPPVSIYSAKEVSVGELFDCIQEIGWREPFKPVYERQSFEWMMAQAKRASLNGTLRLLTIHGPDGLRVGWHAYYVKPQGAAYVLQAGVRRRDQFAEVLRALFKDAWEAGCCVVKGQAIPSYLIPLTEQYCIFRHPNPSVLVHSRDASLMNPILFGDAAITRLDGECWIPLSSQP